jgi:hypothetical protein
MIRRGFWLMTGAVTGIYGYRRVCAAGRRVTGTLSNKTPGKKTKRHLAREAFRFARDVREGMELYTVRHDALPGSTLTTNRKATDRKVTDRGVTDREARPEDGR